MDTLTLRPEKDLRTLWCVIWAIAFAIGTTLLLLLMLANAVLFAGYVTVEDWSIVGGGTVVHQFVRLGRHCMVGGGSRISQDVAPFVRLAGSPPRLAGINRIGLERRGFPPARCDAIERAYRTLFRRGLTVEKAVAEIRAAGAGDPEVEHFARFAETSVRGLTR